MPVKVAVLGRGISGLAAAHFLGKAGHEVVSIDAAALPGGLIRSERIDGYLCETGPQALLNGPAETRALVAGAGLEARIVPASATARRRFIHTRGELHPLPLHPIALARTRLLGWRGKLRLLREPFIRNQPADPDESVLAFGTRRFGEEAARALLAPAVIGIYAGDAAQLSARSALPRLWRFEQARGSVVRGALAQRRAGGGGFGRAISFPDGLQELARALDPPPGPRRIVARATRIARAGDGAGWRIELGDGLPAVEAGAVVVAIPARAAAELLDTLAPEAATGLRSIATAPAVVVCLGFRDAAIGVDLRGYGFLVARAAPGQAAEPGGGRAPVLGCQYESSIFPGRAPAGAVLLRAILGGTFDPTIVDENDESITALTIADLRRLAGLSRAPDFVRIWRHREGIPQYAIGHAARVAAIDAALTQHPGLHLMGNALRGVGLNDCIAAASALVGQIP